MSDDRRMFRYEVGVAGGWQHELTGDPVHVASGVMSVVVEFWAEHDEAAQAVRRTFRVFGTGHPLPRNARYVGTCPRTADGLVWHLYELISDEEARDG